MSPIVILIKTCLFSLLGAFMLGVFSFVALKIAGSKEVRVSGVTVMNVILFIVMLVAYMVWASLVFMAPEIEFFKKGMFPFLATVFVILLVIGMKTFGYVSWGRALLASFISVIVPAIALYFLVGSQISDPEKIVEIVTNPLVLLK